MICFLVGFFGKIIQQKTIKTHWLIGYTRFTGTRNRLLDGVYGYDLWFYAITALLVIQKQK